MGRARHRTQLIVLGWCIWLIGSWVVTLGAESTKVASRLMMPFAALIGLFLLWPMVRLSQWEATTDQERAAPSPAQVLWEWLCLNMVTQAVVWPLTINARWNLVQAIWLDLLLVSWSLLAGLVIAWGSCHRALGRAAAMVLCLIILLGEPALMGLLSHVAGPGSGLSWQMRVSPIGALWLLTQSTAPCSSQVAVQVLPAMAAAIVGWLGLALTRSRD